MEISMSETEGLLSGRPVIARSFNLPKDYSLPAELPVSGNTRGLNEYRFTDEQGGQVIQYGCDEIEDTIAIAVSFLGVTDPKIKRPQSIDSLAKNVIHINEADAVSLTELLGDIALSYSLLKSSNV